MELTGEYEVFAGEARAGRLTVARRGPRTEFEFRSDAIFDVSRIICIGGGTVASIGIPVPKDGGLHLRREFSDAALSELLPGGIESCLLIPADRAITDYLPAPVEDSPEQESSPEPEPVPEPEPLPEDGAEDVPEMNNYSEDANYNMEDLPGWRREDDPARYFSDAELAKAAGDIEGALVSREDGAVLLAFPWSSREPFPLLPAFQSGRSAEIDGKPYIVYRLTGDIN